FDLPDGSLPVPADSPARAAARLFFNATATTEIYTLSLHDALPISPGGRRTVDGAGAVHPARAPARAGRPLARRGAGRPGRARGADRKSTRLNSSHVKISYAVFCLKKKR